MPPDEDRLHSAPISHTNSIPRAVSWKNYTTTNRVVLQFIRVERGDYTNIPPLWQDPSSRSDGKSDLCS